MAGNRASGRKALPTHLKLLEGKNYRMASRAGEPLPTGDLEEAPCHLSKRQREIWDYAIKHAPYGLLKKLDQAMLTAWCVSQALHEEATVALNNGPTIIRTANGSPIQSPWVGVLNRQAFVMRSLVSELGFSPASRTRISIDEADEEDDPAAKYFT